VVEVDGVKYRLFEAWHFINFIHTLFYGHCKNLGG
jgi:hypothetical protein